MYAEWADEDGQFALNGLLVGTYALWAFVDRDGDGEYDSGSLSPFRYAEPYGRYAEPVELDAGPNRRGSGYPMPLRLIELALLVLLIIGLGVVHFSHLTPHERALDPIGGAVGAALLARKSPFRQARPLLRSE